MNEEKLNNVVLLILDGWGLSPSWGGNAISMAAPENFDRLWRTYPHYILKAYDHSISEKGFVGNSEIGHMAISSGKFIKPNFDYINDLILSGEFNTSKALKESANNAKKHDGSVHLIGMLSDAGIHSHINHLFALIDLFKREEINNIYIHVITDGRDTDNTDGIVYINRLVSKLLEIGVGEIASISGRSYAMDKSGNFDRIGLAYKAIVNGEGEKAIDPRQAVSRYYQKGVTDDVIPPTVMTKDHQPVGKINDFDSVVFFNFRPDRMQELLTAFIKQEEIIKGVKKTFSLDLVTLTDYFLSSIGNKVKIAFQRTRVTPTLTELIDDHHFRQVHIAESEKASHVTYFFNGGVLSPYPLEQRVIVPSPNAFDLSKTPELSLGGVTDALSQAIDSGKFRFILANIANVDVIGHYHNLNATTKAIEAVDNALKVISEKCLKHDYSLIITADHGNAEQMVDIDGLATDPEIAHTINPVPFILVDKDFIKSGMQDIKTDNLLAEILSSKRSLEDIAPTVLKLLNIEIPKEMVGKPLI